MKTILTIGLALAATVGIAAPIAGFREGGTTFGLWQGAGDGDAAGKREPLAALGTNVTVKAATDYANALIRNDRYAEAAVFARAYRTQRAKDLDGVETARWLGRELGAWSRAHEEEKFRALCAEFARLPIDDALVDGLTVVRDLLSFWQCPRWPEIAALAKPLAEERGRFAGPKLLRVDSLLLTIAIGCGDVAEMKRIYAQICETYETLERKNPWLVYDARTRFANEMLKREEWAAAVPALETQLDRRNPNAYINLLKAEARLGHVERVRELAEVLAGTNTTANANHKFEAGAVLAWFDATDPASLRRNLAKLRGDRDDATWFDLLRRAGRIYFSFDATERRTDWHKEVIAMSRELLWPEERVEYTLTWLEDAPRSAEAAYRAGLFGKLKTENRMAVYNCYSLFEKNSEKNLLKSKPAPHLAADAPGREAAVCAAYDAWGLHVYMRFNDPEAEKAKDGLAGGFSCEYDFQPGGEAPWHWNMITRADRPNVDQGAVWDSPRPGFKVGAEYIVEDSFSSSDCHVFHVFVPWILCWREFPKDGDVWRMVIAASWSGQFGTMGGGAVHELGRAMQLKFSLPEEARAKMLRKLLREAVSDYRKVRDKWENASFWSDPDLGDPAFNEAVAKPFVEACDKLAEECVADTLTDARAAEILATRLGDLADFRLALDKKRADYVRAKLFKSH